MSRPPEHRRRTQALAWTLSGVAHAAVFVAVLSARAADPPAEAPPMMVQMVALRDITPPPAPKPDNAPAPPKPPWCAARD